MASVLNTPALSANDAANPRTLGVTVHADADKVVFGIVLNGSVSITACTLNGVAYSRSRRNEFGGAAAAFEVVEFDAPATTGAVDLVITFSDAPNNYVIQYDLGDVATGAPEAVVNGPGPTREAALTTTVGAVVLLFAGDTSNTAMTPSGGLTEDVDAHAADLGVRFASGNLIADATSETPSFGAEVGDSGVIGLSFANAAANATLTVDTQPSTGTSGVALSNVIIDSSDTGSTATVTATIETGGGSLSGTTAVAMVAGVATFSNLIITGTGAHTLAFNATAHDEVVSSTITVSAAFSYITLQFNPLP